MARSPVCAAAIMTPQRPSRSSSFTLAPRKFAQTTKDNIENRAIRARTAPIQTMLEARSPRPAAEGHDAEASARGVEDLLGPPIAGPADHRRRADALSLSKQ